MKGIDNGVKNEIINPKPQVKVATKIKEMTERLRESFQQISLQRKEGTALLQSTITSSAATRKKTPAHINTLRKKTKDTIELDEKITTLTDLMKTRERDVVPEVKITEEKDDYMEMLGKLNEESIAGEYDTKEQTSVGGGRSISYENQTHA